MRQKFKELLNKTVEFFDDKTGSLLDVRANYRTDWWSAQNIQVTNIGKKDFEVTDWETGERARYRYNRVKEVTGNEITFI